VRRPIQILLLSLVALAGAAAMTGTAAAAKTPCWQILIDDWYDGRIDSVYPVACYRDALEHMPEDVAQYSSLEDDLNRALAAAIASQGSNGSTGGGSGGSTGGGSGGGGGTTKTASGSTFHGGPRAAVGRAVVGVSGRDKDGGPVGAAISSLGPDSADAVPVPLIVLGSLSLALLALGTVGLLARRAQTRRTAVRQGAKP
jgi:hypothetical protein